jgi:hypothetical protein
MAAPLLIITLMEFLLKDLEGAFTCRAEIMAIRSLERICPERILTFKWNSNKVPSFKKD